jgi:hypothetical protein
MAAKIIPNGQIINIKAQNLERPSKKEKYDSTIEERDRAYETRKPEPRFGEYR